MRAEHAFAVAGALLLGPLGSKRVEVGFKRVEVAFKRVEVKQACLKLLCVRQKDPLELR